MSYAEEQTIIPNPAIVATRVIKEVCDEFFEWEKHECQAVIKGLSKDALSPGAYRPVLESFSLGIDTIPGTVTRLESTDEGDYLEVSAYRDYEVYTSTVIPGVVVVERQQPSQRYYSCTPSLRSVRDLEIGKMEEIDFIPHADDPEFPIRKYLGLIRGTDSEPPAKRGTVWESEEFRDPDGEAVEMEAIRRLLYRQHLSLQQIDETQVFKRPMRARHDWGLLWIYSQRDPLVWPGAQNSNLPVLDLAIAAPAHKWKDVISYGFSRFCGNLNCVVQSCQVHEHDYSGLPVTKAKVHSTAILAEAENCGTDCVFRREYFESGGGFNDDHQPWDHEDVDLLKLILEITPDEKSCKLAVLCRKPCWETFVYRTLLLPDEDIEDDIEVTSTVDDEANQSERKSVAVEPCTHKGPCSRDSSCRCFLAGGFCSSSCRCSEKCGIRWKGCSCRDRCSTDNCTCRKFSRECDPQVCMTCDARAMHEMYPPERLQRSSRHRRRKHCKNTMIQRHDYPLIEIRPSRHGLGAFTKAKLQKHTCIGEYTGEIFRNDGSTNAMINSRETVNIYRHLNYMFSLETNHDKKNITAGHELIIDAASVGNETRYLNHSNKPNCETRHYIVNGERRISVVTIKRIEAGSELLLDYGDLYWVHQGLEADVVLDGKRKRTNRNKRRKTRR